MTGDRQTSAERAENAVSRAGHGRGGARASVYRILDRPGVDCEA